MYRHTGCAIQVVITYTNRDPGELILGLDTGVEATVSVELEYGGFTSTGPKTFHPVYPTSAGGVNTYHSVIRYPQDIEVTFAFRGYAYAFNNVELVQAIVIIFVLVGIVKAIMDIVVFVLLPNISSVLRNKRDEETSRESAFRELGMHRQSSHTVPAACSRAHPLLPSPY